MDRANTQAWVRLLFTGMLACGLLAACDSAPYRPELVAAVNEEFPTSKILEATNGKACFFFRFSLTKRDLETYLKSQSAVENGWVAAPFLILDVNGNLVGDNHSVPLDCPGDDNQWMRHIYEGPQDYYFRVGAGGLIGFFAMPDSGDLVVFGWG